MNLKMILLSLSMLLILSCQAWQNAWGAAGRTRTIDTPVSGFSVATIAETTTSTLTKAPNTTPIHTGTATLDPITVTAVFIEQQSTLETADAQEESTIATSTASAKNAMATVNAINITATAKVKNMNATATAKVNSSYATEIAQYAKIDPNELVTNANNHIGESVAVRGRVFYVINNTDFQIWLDGIDYEAVYISMVNSYSDIFESNYVTVYGIVAGESCGPNPSGEEVCQPKIVGIFYEKK